MTKKKTTKKKAAKKKPGRPKGAKTNPPPLSVKQLGRCKYCDSTELRVLTSVAVKARGYTKAGEKYTTLRKQRCKCGNCQRISMVGVPEFDPNEWDE